MRTRIFTATTLMWPNARISVMGGLQAASVFSTVATYHRKKDKIEAPILRNTNRKAIRIFDRATWDDGIIDPLDTLGA